MQIYNGKSVYNGIAIGKIQIWKNTQNSISCYHTDDSAEEYKRFQKALEVAKQQLSELYVKANEEVGEENAAIFEIHKLMLEDKDYLEAIENIICNQGLNAEYAISVSCKTFAAMFSAMDDSYMQARSIDVKDVSERIIRILNGKSTDITLYQEPSILVAEDFTPSETLQLDKSKILAFATSKGSINSHTAILARTMNIPALIGVNINPEENLDRKLAIVDGYTGRLIIDPDSEILVSMQKKQDEEREKKELLQTLKGKESITADGKKINLYSNIGNIKDLPHVLQNDAEGIGLFRSEFIFLEKKTFPSEEEQFAIYKSAVETMAPKKVIIRTLDIGADKQVDYFGLKEEDNPALGLRAIRLCLKNPEIFKTQLRALLRAAVYGNLAIMYPMITSTDEIAEVKRILNQTASELDSQQTPYKIPEQGIMIETPAAALISDELAKEVSFFSIGTNDLSQYVMAIDRQNVHLDEFFDPHHKAVLKLIDLTIKNAHKAGIWAGICGELAADISLTETFLRMGVDELSVAPGRVLPIRKCVREINLTNEG